MNPTKLVRYTADVYESGQLKHAAGQYYPIHEDAPRHVALGIAEEVEVDPDVEKAERLAAEARAAAEKAAEAAAEVERLAEAASTAQRLADEALAALDVVEAAAQTSASKQPAASGKKAGKAHAPAGTKTTTQNQ